MSRVLAWFSCGVASAVAAKLAVEKYQLRAVIVYCDTLASEHSDNMRFMRDVEKWIGRPVVKIGSTKYASVDDVFETTRYMSGPAGARCTVEMKKVPRFAFQRPDDIHVFGFTADERNRIETFKRNNPELLCDWLLADQHITKAECHARVGAARIEQPAMYALGFRNNNCIGCVKASSPKYWDRVRQYFPYVFARRARQSREIGARLVRVDGVRVFLDELPETIPDLWSEPEPDVECGPQCVTAEAAP